MFWKISSMLNGRYLLVIISVRVWYLHEIGIPISYFTDNLRCNKPIT